MSRRLFLTATALVLAGAAGMLRAAASQPGESPRGAHDFSFTDIDGAPLPLSQFRGRPVLVVNTASRCGFTGQYAGLQALWERYRDAGLVVLGVPSDEFNQELASDAEVKSFCELNYGVDFPLTTITSIKGNDAHPFYAWAERVMGARMAPRWNFHKYLIDGEGRLVGSFATSVSPTSSSITNAVEQALSRAS
jgi:glutathione peroxidase